MQNFVISLTTSQDRREHICNKFGKYNIPFEFFDAITPNQIDSLSIKFDISLTDTFLKKSEIACLFSHVSLWQKLLNSEYDYFCIFEDDIFLSQDCSYFFEEINRQKVLNQIKLLNVIKIETFQMPVYLAKTQSISQYIKISKLKSVHFGTAGYLITKKGAKIFLEILGNLSQNKQLMPIDHVMFDKFLSEVDVFQMLKPICIQDAVLNSNIIFESIIQKERKERTHPQNMGLIPKNIHLNLWQKIFRELTRPFKQAHKKIFTKTLNFN